MKKLLLILSVVALVGMTSCKKSHKPIYDDEADEVEAVDEEPEPVVEEATPMEMKFEISGVVGKYPIDMLLVMHSNGEISGKYRYTKSGNGDWLLISGVMNSDHTKMQIVEKYDGKITGDWQLDINSLEPNVNISGKMTNYKGKDFPVQLTGKQGVASEGTYSIDDEWGSLLEILQSTDVNEAVDAINSAIEEVSDEDVEAALDILDKSVKTARAINTASKMFY
ncbi:MAG: hypothetical protein NC111_04665 [Bacteroides sp.]|nr:hypothetical protein [Bacteroides sp.]MCM1413984.1 hypothetical protein [Bacteroides sp.]MCM1471799.1 hypothetical protein [Bacteroides sp.]